MTGFGGILAGKSLMDLAKERRTEDFSDAGNPIYSSELELNEPEVDVPNHGFLLQLKKKRRAQMLRQMLDDQGYGDLAKMVKIKEF